MKCLNPNCNYFKTKAINSIELKKGHLTRRRRYCFKCQTRYTTLEVPLYIGSINKESCKMFKQVIHYFSGNDPYAQWQQFFNQSIKIYSHISHSQIKKNRRIIKRLKSEKDNLKNEQITEWLNN
jgi:hypothetical protein